MVKINCTNYTELEDKDDKRWPAAHFCPGGEILITGIDGLKCILHGGKKKKKPARSIVD